MVDNRTMQDFAGPVVSIRIKPFAGQEEIFEVGKVIFFGICSVRVFLFNGPESGWGSEQYLYAMLGDDPPEGSWIRVPMGLPS